MLNIFKIIIILTFQINLCFSSLFIPTPKDFKNSLSNDLTLVVPLVPPKEKQLIKLISHNKILKTWKTTDPAMLAKIDRQNLYVSIRKKNTLKTSRGETPSIEVLNKDSKVLRTYQLDGMHHDFTILPGKKIAAWVIDPIHINGRLRDSDKIVILSESNKIEWEWRAHKHINKKKWKSKGLEIFHMNSIQYISKNPINNKEAFLISSPFLGEIFLIDKISKKILWSSKKIKLIFQHDPHYLKNGNILVFDNGISHSRVIEININKNTVIWEYKGSSVAIETHKQFNSLLDNQFHSPIISGARRLSNGNTLITDGLRGHIFEVTASKKTIWNYFEYKKNKNGTYWPFTSIFKAVTYPKSKLQSLLSTGSTIIRSE